MNDWVFNTSNFDKFFVGSDKMIQALAKVHETAAKAIPGYPPYNIAKVDDNRYVIEMAVAGFAKSNIDIEVANNTLVVKGSLEPNPLEGVETNPITEYLYKGIADRAFTRRFTLADTVEVKNAELINGMLKLWLENIIPDEKKSKKVNIVDTAETGKK